MVQLEIINLITMILTETKGISFAYFFGSILTNEFSKNSDVDIAIGFADKSYDLLKLHHKLAMTTHRDVDIVVLNKVHNLKLLDEIIHKGKLVVDTDSESRINFELISDHNIKDYAAFKRYLNAG